MNKHTVDAMADAALRDLDPARATDLTDADRERADATLARILATPSHDETAEGPTRRRRRWSRLLVPVGLVGGVGAAVPALLLGGGSAFGSWTPTPEPLTGAAAAEAASACRAILAVPDQAERVVIADRRGDWTYVLFAGPDSEGSCLMPEGLVGQQDSAAHRTEGFMGGYDSDPPAAPTPARDRIIQTGAGATSVPTHGLWNFGDDEEWVNQVEGHVGSNVVGVTVHTPIGTDVEASVANGRFAAWWPSAKPSSENLEVMGAWTYTVTLADGTTRQAS
jgi:hypothetical protein